MRITSLFAATTLFVCTAAAGHAQPLFNATFDTDVSLWNPGGGGTIAWSGDNDNTGNSGGSIAVTVADQNPDNSSVASAIGGSVQFNGFTTDNAPEQVLFTAYAFVDDPLVEAPDISSGNGGAAIALIDGAVDFTGVITADEDRILDNEDFEEISAPILTVQGGGRIYNTWLLVRNATGTVYFDDLLFEDPAANSVEDWDIY